MKIPKEIMDKCFLEYQSHLNSILIDESDSKLLIKNSREMEKNFYVAYPFLFLSHYEKIANEDVYHLTLCGNIFFTWIRLFDSAIDKHKSDSNSLSLWLLNEAFLQNIYKLFSADSNFWSYYSIYKGETLWTMAKEKKSKKSNEIDDDTLLKIAKYKSSFSKCATAGLTVLAGVVEDPFVESQDYFHCGLQLLDDFQDWKIDYIEKNHSYVVHLLFRDGELKEKLIKCSEADQLKIIGRYIYYSGFAVKIIDTAKTSFESALRCSADKNVPLWHSLIGDYISKCDELRRYYTNEPQWILSKHNRLKQIHSPVNSGESLLSALRNHDAIIKRGINYIFIEHQHDYIEMNHRLMLPNFDENNSEVAFTVSLFQRMILLDNMMDLETRMIDSSIKEILLDNWKYIIKARQKEVKGGWSYYPDYPWIPPDSDSLSQAIKILVKGQYWEEKERIQEDIDLLVNYNRYEDGSFRTWVLDPFDSSLLQQNILGCVSKYWGEYYGRDVEVTMNVILALSLFDKAKYREIIESGMEKVFAMQTVDGYWHSAWYTGNYYGIQLVAKLINTTQIYSDNVITKIINFLIASQHSDGGWGVNKSDPLNTAYALLGISYLSPFIEYNACSIINRAMEYLVSQQKNTGSWDAVKFICMPRKVVPFRSETITTSYVLTALTKTMDHKRI